MDRIVSIFPMLAFMLFWLTAGLISAIVTGKMELVILGIITLPVAAVIIFSAVRSYRK